MEKSSIMKIVGMTVWLITALACLNIGLHVAFGFNFFEVGLVQQYLGPVFKIIHYIIGLAGAISLVHFFMACSHECNC